MKQPDNEPLTREEIEAILEKEATELPAESHERMKPVQMAGRDPGDARFGAVWIWLLVFFMVLGVVQSVRG